MNTESISEHRTPGSQTTASGALAADLAADSADLLDVSAALGVELRRVVMALLREPQEPAPSVVRALAAVAPHPRTTAPSPGGAPFVWVRLLEKRRALSVRAGW